MGYFAAYEFLVYVVPGGLLLFFISAMFRKIRALFGQEPVNVGGLVVFLIVAYVLGQLLHSAASYTIQEAMKANGYAYRTSQVLFTDQTVITAKDRALLGKRVVDDFGFDPADLQHKSTETISERLKDEWRAVVRRVHSRINLDQQSDRANIYVQYYALNMVIAAAFIAIFVLLLVIKCMPVYRRTSLQITILAKPLEIFLLVAIPVAILISLERMSSFDRQFAEELFSSYIHNKPKPAQK